MQYSLYNDVSMNTQWYNCLIIYFYDTQGTQNVALQQDVYFWSSGFNGNNYIFEKLLVDGKFSQESCVELSMDIVYSFYIYFDEVHNIKDVRFYFSSEGMCNFPHLQNKHNMLVDITNTLDFTGDAGIILNYTIAEAYNWTHVISNGTEEQSANIVIPALVQTYGLHLNFFLTDQRDNNNSFIGLLCEIEVHGNFIFIIYICFVTRYFIEHRS